MTGEEFLLKLDSDLYGGDGTVARLQLPAVPCDCGEPFCDGWVLSGLPHPDAVTLPDVGA